MTTCAAFHPDANKTVNAEGTITSSVMGTIAFIATILRTIGRLTTSGTLGIDDWLIIASTVCYSYPYNFTNVYINIYTNVYTNVYRYALLSSVYFQFHVRFL